MQTAGPEGVHNGASKGIEVTYGKFEEMKRSLYTVSIRIHLLYDKNGASAVSGVSDDLNRDISGLKNTGAQLPVPR